DFGSRLLASVNLSTLPNNSAGDGRGHGTFVAGVAAGSAPGYAGASPSSNLVSIDVMDDSGMGLTSDIINACQWILDHKAQYNINDDSIAPWSAWGSTIDGFMKPEVSADGRYMIGPVPVGSTLPAERPTAVVAPGYIQLSGTSFASPAVAGVAAQIIARHPGFTPDQVKGALMLTTRPVNGAVGGAAGVGEITANKAAAVTDPPNPNAGLD